MKFKDASKKMIKYLKSNKFKTREDAQDTQKSINILCKINSKYITYDSQEGKKQTYNKKPYKERAYIIGFMESKNAVKYMDKINDTDKVAIIVYNIDDYQFKSYKRGYDISLTKYNTFWEPCYY